MRLSVSYDNKPCYDIICVTGDEQGALSFQEEEQPLAHYLEALYFAKRRIAIVTDAEVGALYADAIRSECEQITDTVRVIVLPAGEAHKHLGTVHQIYERLLEAGFDRHDLIIALGGGVVGDIAGFAAATYLRGISFVQVPTTLLAQTDSSIGGKTGVDFQEYKNMVGAFYMPKLVYIHTSVLKTLPERQILAGLAEVIKYGLICDEGFYERVVRDLSDRSFLELLADDSAEAEAMITESCKFKAQVVEEDPKETGRRAILNFGHTLGHAIEKRSGFTLLHGECVAIGSIAAAYLSMKRGMLTSDSYERIRKDFAAIGLPVSLADVSFSMWAEEILDAMRSDKKKDGDHVKFILLDGIGKARICDDVTEDEVREALRIIGAEGV